VTLARFVIVVAIAAGLPTFLGCGSTSDTTEPPAETGTVRGWVRHRYTLQGVAGASVTCANRTTVSDGTGGFELADLPQESTAIAAAAEGYQALSTPIDIRSFQTVMLDLAPLDTLADVSGVVRHPIHGAVNATILLDGRSTVADYAGRWALADVPLGPRSLVISHPDYVPYATSVVVWGDGQEILSTLQRDSTFVAPITADAGIHWSPVDGDENNYGDEAELSLRPDPPRSVLLAIPASLGPEGASVREATLYLYGYLEQYMPPLPASLPLELRAVFGVWYETSVDATNFPSETGLLYRREAAITEQDEGLRLALDVASMFTRSPTGPSTGILVSVGDESDPPLVIYSREAVPSARRPWLSITIRF
jgi:hypothetical protein